MCMSLFLADMPHQTIFSRTAPRLWVLAQFHEHILKYPLDSLSAFLFYSSAHRFLVCVFCITSSVSVGLGLNILTDVSSLAHDPHFAGEILFLYWYPCEVLRYEGHNWSLWEREWQWMTYVRVLMPVAARHTTRLSC